MKIRNKKAYFNYEFIESVISGVVLKGTEIKSIRNGKVSFTDSFCYFKNGELWLKNLHISEYENASYDNHDPKRDRKLLLTKQQLSNFETKMNEKGLTIIPKELFINEKGLVKIEISLSKGRKTYNKKQLIKENDIKREMDRDVKNYK
jgi:SsrA-binding protein